MIFKHKDQRGLASFMVTGILVSLIGITAIAFGIIMNRESAKSTAHQIGQAAYDAAQSGINDAISYLRDNPDTKVTQCGALVGPGNAFASSANLSGDSSTQYTCVLINPTPNDIIYQSIPSNQTQVIKASTSTLMSKLMVSWQASNRNNNIFVPVGVATSATNLLDETTWGVDRYPPVLQISLYPVPADTHSLDTASADERTYFLYPSQATGSSITTIDYASATNASTQQVSCGVTDTGGAFSGTADYDCNTLISNLPNTDGNGYIYYIVITPIYGNADVKFRGNDATNQALQFVHTQAIVDVTAQSSGAVKRLQARVDSSGLSGTSQNITPSSNGLPNNALRVVSGVCKRIQLPSIATAPAYIGSDAISSCYKTFQPVKLNPPEVSLNSPSYGGSGSITLSGTANSNGVAFTACYFSITGNDGYSSQKDCSPYPGAGSSNLSMGFSGLAQYSTSYTAKLCASNAANAPGTVTCDTKLFSAPPPPPPPPNCNDYNVSWSAFGVNGTTVNYSVHVQGNNPCGLVFYQCNLLNSGGGSIAQLTGNYSNSWTNTVSGAGYNQTSSMTCQTQDGKVWAYNTNPPPPPAPINIQAYYRLYGSFNATCKDGVHPIIKCVVWSSSQSGGTIDYCYVSNNSGVQYGGMAANYGGNGVTFGYWNYTDSDNDVIKVTCHSSTYGNTNTVVASRLV